jgi:hypothetical protein
MGTFVLERDVGIRKTPFLRLLRLNHCDIMLRAKRTHN